VDSDSNEPIAFLWIDVSNNFSGRHREFRTTHGVADGWIVFDDAVSRSFPDVIWAISERMHGRNGIEEVRMIKNFAVYRCAT